MSKLGELRQKAGKSREDMVRELFKDYDYKVSRETLIRWENTGNMTAYGALRLARYFNVKVEDVVG